MLNLTHTQKSIEAEKNGGTDWKALYKLMTNAMYGRTFENLEMEMI